MTETLVEKITWLAINLYFEAPFEPLEGQRLVCQAVLNRAKDKRWPSTVKAVVFQKYQFSWTLYSEKKKLIKNFTRLAKCAQVAFSTYLRWTVTPFPTNICWYHADYIKKPEWAYSYKKYKHIGKHIFYVDK